MADDNNKRKQQATEPEQINQLLTEWVNFCTDIAAQKRAISERVFEIEHTQKYQSNITTITPEADIFGLEHIELSAHEAPDTAEVRKLKHALIAAISRHPGEDTQIAAQAIAILQSISTAAAVVESDIDSELRSAADAVRAANERLKAARARRKAFRLDVNGRLLRSFRNAVRAGEELGARFMQENVNKPSTSIISGLASTHGSVMQMCEMLGDELETANRAANQRRTIPEREKFTTVKADGQKAFVSPDELKFIGANDGNKGGLRNLVRNAFGN